MTQKAKIYAYMMAHKTITQREANALGVYRLAARVFDMRHQDGIDVRSELTTAINADGEPCRYSTYWIDPEWIRKNETKHWGD